MSEAKRCDGCGSVIGDSASEVGSGLCPSCAGSENNQSKKPRSENIQGEVEVSVHAVRKALTKRLAVILKGFEGLPSGNREIQSIEAVLKAVRGEIASGYGPNGEDLDYIELAAQLSFVISPLKRAGHDDLAEEVLLVKQTIEKLATVAPRVPAKTEASEEIQQPANTQKSEPIQSMASSARRDSAVPTRKFPVFFVVLAVVVLGIVAAVSVWFLRSGAPAEGVAAEVSQQPVVAEPSTTPVSLSEVGVDGSSAPDFELFWDLVGEAKRLVQTGEAENAIAALDQAAAISREKSDVFKTAELIKQRFIAMAQEAISDKNWEYGDALLARAIDVAADYGLATDDIDKVVNDLRKTDWVYRISPDDVRLALRNLVGVEIIVEQNDGSTQVGTVREIKKDELILSGQQTLGGGRMDFSAEINLDNIRFISFKKQPDLAAVKAARERSAKQKPVF